MGIIVSCNNLMPQRRDCQCTPVILVGGGGTIIAGNIGNSGGAIYCGSGSICVSGDTITAIFGTGSTQVACGSHTHTGLGASCLDALTDVVISAPSANQVLQYNGSTWCNTNTSALSLTSGCPICFNGAALVSYSGGSGGGATCLDALTDVVISTPSNAHILTYTGGTWCNKPTTALSLTTGCIVCYNGTTLTNVGTIAASALPIASASCLGTIRIGTGLSIDGSGIVCVTGGGATCLDALTDVVISTPSNAHILTYTGGTWCNKPTTALSLTTGCIVCYNGTTLTNVGTIAASALPIASASCLGTIRIGTGLSIDGSGIVCATAGSTVGYVIPIFAAALSTMADACTYYFGASAVAPIVTADRARVYIPKTGTIKSAFIWAFTSTAGTDEAWGMCIRKNNTTDTLIQSISCASSSRMWCNTSLNISVNAGDYVQVKTTFPTWSTNPAGICLTGTIYIE